MTNKISIIIPTFNRINKLKKCLESIFFQDYKNYEIIVIDNFSDDGTEEYIKLLKKNIKINYLKIRNKGNIAASRNKGILNSTGNYLAFLDSDDQWSPNKLSKSLKFIEKKNLDFFYHNMFLYKTGIFKKKISFFRNLDTKDIFNDLIVNGPAFATSSVVVKKKIFLKINNFSEDVDLITWEDYDAWLRLSKITNKFGFLDEPLGKVYSGDDNTLTEKNKIKNIFTFEEKYLKKKNINYLPRWCVYSLITSSFKLKKYAKVKEYYETYILENNKIKKSIKIIIIFYISKLISFLI